MPRKIKKFEDISHGPFKAVIRLDPKTGIFSCEYGGEEFDNIALAEVRKWAHIKLRAMSALDWQPVMVVNFDATDDQVNNLKNCSNIRCYLERCYIAWDGKKWVQAPWVVAPRNISLVIRGGAYSEMEQSEYSMPEQELMEQRIAHAQDFYPGPASPDITWPLVEPGRRGDQAYWVPWTEDRWATMLGMLDKIRELRTRIHQLLACERGWIKLAAIAGTKLLAAPEENDVASRTDHGYRTEL